MKNKISKVFKYFVSLGAALLPGIALAQSDFQSGMDSIGGLFPSGGIAGSEYLTGPYGLLYRIIFTMLGLAGIVAVMFIIIGGFWYITSAGNEEQAEKGKNTLLNAIIGIVVIVLSYTIITVVSNFIATGN